jgi:uncharacterized protein YdaL
MSTSTLILYDTTDQWGWMGELYGIMASNLASRFGAWTALPIVSYTAGKMSQYSAVIYIGSTYGEPIPTAFFDDVLAYKTIPVIWAYDNIWQLTAYYSNFSSTYGWNWSGFDSSSVAQVNYKGQHLTRYAPNGAGIMNYSVVGSGVSVLANAVRSDGSTFPWALRSGNLTYVGENPLVYIAEGDRYLAFCDLLFDALAPATASRHRALIRLEDIDPTFDPIALQNVANYLYSQGVPFGFQIVPRYTDPTGYYNNGAPKTIRLKNVPAMVNAIKYMQSKGGVMMEHGYTHQYSNVKNPYTAVTGDDCEFFRLTMNADNTLNYLGPVAEDSTTWASNRVSSAAAEFAAAGFPAPRIFTFPSYLGSATDIKVVGQNFSARAERSLYYVGLLSGSIDSTRYVGQYFPYVVRDVYNTKVLPDNLGGISPDYFFGFAPRLPAQILADAQRSLVVRDGFASFFYNPEDNISYLQTTIKGLKSLGYTFVSPSSL